MRKGLCRNRLRCGWTSKSTENDGNACVEEKEMRRKKGVGAGERAKGRSRMMVMANQTITNQHPYPMAALSSDLTIKTSILHVKYREWVRIDKGGGAGAGNCD